MDFTTTATPQLKNAAREIEINYKKLESFAITDAFEFENAALLLKDIKQRAGELETLRKTMTDPINAAKAAIMDLFRTPTELLDRSKALVLKAMNEWNKAQEAAQAEQRAKAEAEAREREKEARAKLAAEAAKALEEGDAENAEYLIGRAESVTVQTTYTPPAKLAGANTRTMWTYRIVDKAKIPDEFKVIDEKTLGAMARSMKDKASVPGVEFYAEKKVI